jgi:hypothetical protein
LLSAILRVVRTTDTGLVDEDLDEMRESALVRRHFSDPFQQPEIHRVALPDTLVNGALLQRERVHLTEVRRETAGVFTIVTTLRAHAELSRDVPLLGLLRSWTLSEVATESARDEGGGRRRPPLVNENTLVCIDSGRLPDPTLPAGLNRTH